MKSSNGSTAHAGLQFLREAAEWIKEPSRFLDFVLLRACWLSRSFGSSWICKERFGSREWQIGLNEVHDRLYRPVLLTEPATPSRKPPTHSSTRRTATQSRVSRGQPRYSKIKIGLNSQVGAGRALAIQVLLVRVGLGAQNAGENHGPSASTRRSLPQSQREPRRAFLIQIS